MNKLINILKLTRSTLTKIYNLIKDNEHVLQRIFIVN